MEYAHLLLGYFYHVSQKLANIHFFKLFYYII